MIEATKSLATTSPEHSRIFNKLLNNMSSLKTSPYFEADRTGGNATRPPG
jgi:hypothetical protein